jgi:hypothetical protein
MQVMKEVRDELDTNADKYTDGRDTIISIVEAGEEICASIGTNSNPSLTLTPGTPGTSLPEATPLATETLIPDITLTQTP